MEKSQPVLDVRKLWLKDLSFETHPFVGSFDEVAGDDLNVERNIHAEHVQGQLPSEAVFMVTLRMSLTCKQGERTQFIIEASQSGYFSICNMDNQDAEMTINVNCAQILEPYLMQVINDMATRGSFPPIMIQPYDYAEFYREGE
jgi:preprotein translocase subunit SecB